jgi:DNA polymerase III subunit delta'
VASAALEEATEHQGRARVALTAGLAHGPSHAYLFRGPRGSGKRAAARAFAAEILADGADDPDDARRRALLDPSPHPDLVWLAPRGAQHMVDEVRERVIRASVYRPFEGEHRVFVVEAAEAMRDESQNALLKTLEEPPPFVHLILLTSEPDGLLETIASRCQPVDFAPLPAEVVEAQLTSTPEAAGAAPEEIAAAARLAAGDLERARLLLSPTGRELRAEVEATIAATLADELSGAPWQRLLDRATKAGEEAEGAAREALEEDSQAGIKQTAKDLTDGAKRAGRRRRTEILDLGLELTALWLRDLAALAADAEEVAFDRDRLEILRAQATKVDPTWARAAAAAVQDTRQGLDLNVSEELALEALFYRLARTA